MNLRRKQPADSLYLLLDTLCNAFGGIVLLAVLVVLLTSKEKSQSATPSASQAIQLRRLAMAQTNLQQTLEYAAILKARAGDGRWKRQMDLLTTRKELQTALQQAGDAVDENNRELDSVNADDPAERLKFLNAEMARAQARKAAEQNALAVTKAGIQIQQQRLAGVEGQVTAQLNEFQRTLRMPREHVSSKRVNYLIVRYGRIYARHDANGNLNEADIHWTVDSIKQSAEPIPGKGFDPDQITAYFRTFVPDDNYFVFLVYEDSFPAFIRAKQLTINAGISYGWEPYYISDGPIGFAAVGRIPMAQ